MSHEQTLRHHLSNCRRVLAGPDFLYPNGRSAHDVEREIEARTLSELHDLMWEAEFDANGYPIPGTAP